jgi:DNA invertase Pin-like site-specific DNA recombinase
MSKLNNKAIGYCRVAVTNDIDQVERLQSQKNQIIEAAKHLNVEIVKWFEQVGYEPVAFPYSSLSEALRYCEEHPVKSLFVAKADRISRSMEEFYFWKVSFERVGVTIKMADAKWSNETLTHFTEILQTMQTRLYGEQHVERVKKAMLRKAEQGYSVTKMPLGYSMTGTNGLHKPNELGYDMKNVFKDVCHNQTAVQKWLPRLSAVIARHTGKILPTARLKRLVADPYYAGYVLFDGRVFSGIHEPLMTRKQQLRLMEQLNSRSGK